MKPLGIVLMIYVGIAAQTTLVSEIPHEFRPYLPALLLVLIAVWCEPVAAMFWAAVIGVVLDGISTERFGIQLGLTSIVALAIQVLKPLWRSRNFLAIAMTVLVIATMWRSLSPMTNAVLTGRTVDPQIVFGQALREAVSTAAMALAACLILMRSGDSPVRSEREFVQTRRRMGMVTT